MVLHPKVYMQNATVTTIESLAQLLSHVLPVEEIPKVVEKWKALQAENINSSWYEGEIVNNEGTSTTKMTRVHHFWRKIFKIKLPSGFDKYTALPKLYQDYAEHPLQQFTCGAVPPRQ